MPSEQSTSAMAESNRRGTVEAAPSDAAASDRRSPASAAASQNNVSSNPLRESGQPLHRRERWAPRSSIGASAVRPPPPPPLEREANVEQSRRPAEPRWRSEGSRVGCEARPSAKHQRATPPFSRMNASWPASSFDRMLFRCSRERLSRDPPATKGRESRPARPEFITGNIVGHAALTVVDHAVEEEDDVDHRRSRTSTSGRNFFAASASSWWRGAPGTATRISCVPFTRQNSSRRPKDGDRWS